MSMKYFENNKIPTVSAFSDIDPAIFKISLSLTSAKLWCIYFHILAILFDWTIFLNAVFPGSKHSFEEKNKTVFKLA